MKHAVFSTLLVCCLAWGCDDNQGESGNQAGSSSTAGAAGSSGADELGGQSSGAGSANAGAGSANAGAGSANAGAGSANAGAGNSGAGGSHSAGAPTGGNSSGNAGGGNAGGGNAGGGNAGGGNAGGGAVLCPTAPIASGSQCSAQVQCTYLDCSGAGQVTVNCNGSGSTASVETLPCGPIRCGAIDCAAGEVCVLDGHGGVQNAKCVANPCAGRAVGCDCIGSLCGDRSCVAFGTVLTCGA